VASTAPQLRDEQALASLLDERARWIAACIDSAGRRGAVVALSGGIDSAVSLALTVKAVGPERVLALRLPSRHTEDVHLDDAAEVAAALALPPERLLTVSIEPMLEGLLIACPSLADSSLGLGNASARCRMIAVFELARENHALVVGTENRTENLLGYFTRFGDAASDVEPITDLYKTEVRAAARALGLPLRVLEKAPTAGLWADQTDEDELGFSYRDADLALHAVVDQGLDVAEASRATGVPVEVMERVEARRHAVAWKHVVPHVPG
jgi:NAD+ synthase